MSDRTDNGGNIQVCCCESRHHATMCHLSGQRRCYVAQGVPRNSHLDQEFWSLSRGACGVLLSKLWGSAKAAGSLRMTAVPRQSLCTGDAQPGPPTSLSALWEVCG